MPSMMSVRIESPVFEKSTRWARSGCDRPGGGTPMLTASIAGLMTSLKRASYRLSKLIATNTSGRSSIRQKDFKYVLGCTLSHLLTDRRAFGRWRLYVGAAGLVRGEPLAWHAASRFVVPGRPAIGLRAIHHPACG